MKTLAFVLLCAASLSAGASKPPSRVSVQGNHFITADGQTIIFRGLDVIGPDTLEQQGRWNKHYFEMAKSWGANIVRLPVLPESWRNRGKEGYLKLLDQGVKWAEEAGLYVIINWHCMGNLPAGKFYPMEQFGAPASTDPHTGFYTTRQETFDFWWTMARHYEGNNTVAFFELFNEPVKGSDYKGLGECTWSEWKGLMEELIKTIRANGGTAVPLVTGFNYAYDLTPVANAPIAAEGIGYSCHPYPQRSPKETKQPWERNWTHDWGFVSEKYPMILTEIGFFAADAGDPIPPPTSDWYAADESYGDAITSYSAKHGISYTVWSFDPHWAPCLIKDWNFTPTRAGRYFKKVLQSPQP